MAAVEDEARLLGLRQLRLDTNATLTEAVALYTRLGWTPTARYNANPYAQHWFAKTLG
jgi:GNAT superfamily N-acetyltransferase